MNKTSELIACLTITACSTRAVDKVDTSKFDLSKLPPPAQKQNLTFATDIQPLFKASCLRCHGEDRPKGGLQLGSLEAVLKGGKDGKVVVPGDSKASFLVAAVAQVDAEIAMPPKPRGGRGPGGPGGPGNSPGGGGRPPGPGGPNGGPGGGGFGPPPKPLTAEQVGLIRAWIGQGAR